MSRSIFRKSVGLFSRRIDLDIMKNTKDRSAQEKLTFLQYFSKIVPYVAVKKDLINVQPIDIIFLHTSIIKIEKFRYFSGGR